MLTKKQLEDAAKCPQNGLCMKCEMDWVRTLYNGYFQGCISEVAQTALAYREMLKKIQFSTTQVYDNDHIAEYCCPICGGQGYHEVDCELAKLLESEVKHDA